jgi:hypothetical protein
VLLVRKMFESYAGFKAWVSPQGAVQEFPVDEDHEDYILGFIPDYLQKGWMRVTYYYEEIDFQIERLDSPSISRMQKFVSYVTGKGLPAESVVIDLYADSANSYTISAEGLLSSRTPQDIKQATKMAGYATSVGESLDESSFSADYKVWVDPQNRILPVPGTETHKDYLQKKGQYTQFTSDVGVYSAATEEGWMRLYRYKHILAVNVWKLDRPTLKRIHHVIGRITDQLGGVTEVTIATQSDDDSSTVSMDQVLGSNTPEELKKVREPEYGSYNRVGVVNMIFERIL